jgi:ACS family hexuronate transporter-like MFS transporter
MLMAKYAGWMLQTVGSYAPIFVVAASVYGLAVLVIHLLTPRYAPARLG